MKRSLKVKLTPFKLSNNSLDIATAYKELTLDDNRNEMIVDDIIEQYKLGKNILVLTDRIIHLDIIKRMLLNSRARLYVIYGKMTKKLKETFYTGLENEKENFIILSTGSYIGEGFDCDRLDTLFLTLPFRWKGSLSQYIGRLNRVRDGKEEITVFDYADIKVKYFSQMYIHRLKGYKSLDYEISAFSNIESMLYDNNNYEEKLKNDLGNATGITFLVNNKNDTKIDSLIKISNTTPVINFSSNIAANIIIIDNRYVWCGSINPFTFKMVKDTTILRYEDIYLAKELLDRD